MRPSPSCAAGSRPLLFPEPAPPQGAAVDAAADVQGVFDECFRSHQESGDDLRKRRARGSPAARKGQIMTCGEAQQPVPILVPVQAGVEQAELGENPGLANHGGAWAQVASPHSVGEGESAVPVPGPYNGGPSGTRQLARQIVALCRRDAGVALRRRAGIAFMANATDLPPNWRGAPARSSVGPSSTASTSIDQSSAGSS